MAAGVLSRLSGGTFLSDEELTKISFPYGLSTFVNFDIMPLMVMSNSIKFPDILKMEQQQIEETKKRTMG